MPPTKRRITKAQYETLASFRYALRLFLRFSEDAAQSVGLKPQQHQALLAIKGFPDRDSITVGELAERLQIRHHSAVGLVDRLCALRLLSRKVSSEDRRHVELTLTDSGEDLLERLSEAHQAQLRTIGPRITEILQRLSSPGQTG